jgi:hypothetical protein
MDRTFTGAIAVSLRAPLRKDGVGYDPDRLIESVRGTVGVR